MSTLITNLATNPSFEAAGATATVFTNLATNPSFEAAGATVTARTNLVTNPQPISLTNWTGPAAALVAAPWNAARQAVRATASGSATPYVFVGPIDRAIVVGDKIAWRAKVKGSRRFSVGVRRESPAYLYPEGSVTVLDADAPTWREVSGVYTATEALPANGFRLALVAASAGTAGDEFFMGDALVEISPAAGPYFDGSTPAAGDFTYAWTGAANASTSIQRIPRVVGGSDAGVISGQSSEWALSGTKSLRLIATGTARGASYLLLMSSGLTPGKTYTVSATVRMTAAPPVSAAPRILATTPGVVAAIAPEASGVHPLSLTFTVPASGAWTLRLYHMGMAGDPDVWWDDLVITEGAGPVPYFDGSTPAAADFTYAWTGAAHDSTSTQQAVRVANVDAGLAFLAQSSEWALSGTKSMRMISQYPSAGSAYAEVARTGMERGLVAGKTYTMSASVRVPSVGPANSASPRMQFITVGANQPSVLTTATPAVGVHQHVVTFTVPTTGSWYLRLYHSGQQGTPDVWWDNIMIVEGATAYPYADGSTNGWAWNGTAHASTSMGPSAPYVNDARLILGGVLMDYLDTVADFEETAESASAVQTTLNSTGSRHFAVVRPSGPTTGTLTLHFTRELLTGEPGARAEAVAASLKTGAPHTIQYNADISGLSSFEFVPTGTVTRRLEVATAHRKRQAVWTVEVDYTRTDGAA